MSLKSRVLKGDTIAIPAGPSLLESLWAELLKEWADPDVETNSDFDTGYCVGLAYAIAKIEMPYVMAGSRIENVLQVARERKEGILDEGIGE